MEQRNSEAQFDLETLKAEHRTLDERIDRLERQLTVSPTDEFELRKLKKMKLHKKDQIVALERVD